MPGDLSDETFVLTGATAGIGRAAARQLAGRGATVLLACRSPLKAREVVAEIDRDGRGRAEFVPLDLADLASVRDGARAVLDRDGPLRGLINNAGVAGQRGVTAQGFELAFGVNHLGHFLLTSLLLDRLRQGGPARVVTLASVSHRSVRAIDYDAVQGPTRTFTGLAEYAASKFAGVLFSQELARREAAGGVTALAVDPGSVASDIWRRVPGPVRSTMKLLMRSPESGAEGPVQAATAPGHAGDGGAYLVRTRRAAASRHATAAAAAELWRRSEAWVAAPGGGIDAGEQVGGEER